MTTKLYQLRNHLLLHTNHYEPSNHRHCAAHLILSLQDYIDVSIQNQTFHCKGIIIPSKMKHSAYTYGNQVLVFLFDQTTMFAKENKRIMELSDDNVTKIIDAYNHFQQHPTLSSYQMFMKQAQTILQMNLYQSVNIEERITESISYIRMHLHEALRCADVAKQVHLSESRFSHLFKAQLDMTFASFVIYQRLMKAYKDIFSGTSITNAAINTGFSSSSHFAEINKKRFGLNAQTIHQDVIFIKLAEI